MTILNTAGGFFDLNQFTLAGPEKNIDKRWVPLHE
jgi:hypothetical protein